MKFPVRMDSGEVGTFTGYRYPAHADHGPDEGRMDTDSQQVGHSVPAIVTGKPVVLGRTAGRQSATGLGAVHCLEAAMRRLGRELIGKRVVGQGAGNVGAVIARELHARGRGSSGSATSAAGWSTSSASTSRDAARRRSIFP